MPVPAKNKVLGQYFSGEFVARLLCSLLEVQPNMDIIDPMAGIGDMFLPLIQYPFRFTAVEIDPDAHKILLSRIPTAVLGNAFAQEQINSYSPSGYDLVITNPPYVRRELLKESKNLPFYLPIEHIYDNLRGLANRSLILSQDEKELFLKTLDSISGRADIAIPSWLLCILLTKPGGELALVVPSSWMTREYAKPLISLLTVLFEIKFIFKDVNSSLFKGKALVQTNLVVAKRKIGNYNSSNGILVISGYESFLQGDNCIEQLHSLVERKESIPNNCTIQFLPQNELILDSSVSHHANKALSFLSSVVDLEKIPTVTLSDLGVLCNQGFRSGANSFFYFSLVNDSLRSGFGDSLPIEHLNHYYTPAFQNQDDLKGLISPCSTSHYLLNIQDSARKEEIGSSEYNILPEEISYYITLCESRSVKGTLIPSLSAVRTNNRSSVKGRPPRFWYMLPSFTRRHRPSLFMPRVNSERTFIYYNEVNFVVDANFVTFNISDGSPISSFGLLALLNSTWSAIQFEEICSVMGGGALKVDSVQLSQFFFPTLSQSDFQKLDKLGKDLASQRTNTSQSIINQIDRLLISATGEKAPLSKIHAINDCLTHYIKRRNGSK